MNRQYFLEITLQSPLISSGGEGRAGQVDIEIEFDSLGLPVISGKRLKGLWRDAYREVIDAWELCKLKGPAPEIIFGRSGKQPGKGTALFYIQDACLRESYKLRRWVKYFQEQAQIRDVLATRVFTDDVIEYFANTRAQTAIDRHTGSALENSLRITRTLRAGLVFRAPLYFLKPPDNQLLCSLALGAAALRYMGTERTRGVGEVICRLLCLNDDQEEDLTQHYLKQTPLIKDIDWKITKIKGTGEDKIGTSSKSKITANSEAVSTKIHPPSHLLRYHLILNASAIIPTLEGDPNTVFTRSYIPGSNILGVFAHKYLQYSGHSPKNVTFQEVFLSGGTRFLSAYPESLDEEKIRLIPIPHSIRQDKKDELIIEFLELDSFENQDMVRRLDGKWASISSEEIEYQIVETQLSYHHARAIDRRKGRAIGEEIEDGGTLFVYESIQPGQTFQGAVLGSLENLKKLRQWIFSDDCIRIGRSKSAQYGGEAKICWMDEEPLALSKVEAEWYGFMQKEEDDEEIDTENEKEIVITTISPLLTVNEMGHPVAKFPLGELKEILALPDDAILCISHSYTRSELIGGYYSHLRLPRQQYPAIAAGSVFVVESDHSISNDKLFLLENDGLGLRREEGFGRLAINRQKNLNLSYQSLQKIQPISAKIPNPYNLPPEVKAFLSVFVQKKCISKLHALALDIAEEISLANTPNNSLLNRLNLILQENSLKTAFEVIHDLRKRAKKQLMETTVVIKNNWPRDVIIPSNLKELLDYVMENPEPIVKAYVMSLLQGLLGNSCQSDREKIVNNVLQQAQSMIKKFCQILLSTIRRKSVNQVSKAT